MWCSEGLESVINATEEDQNHLIDILSDRPESSKRLGEILYYMTMRARFNTQRHYEIYAVDTDGSIGADDFWTMFDENPQETADLVRLRGRLLHSDRAEPTRTRIV